MPFATDEEIKIAHDILLNDKKPFDITKLNIIKENNSCYVQACPGSGKTTALLAKLVILANRMPLAEGKGICVLTHTNVAIDEIKAKLGTKSDVLFRYPNFLERYKPFYTSMLLLLLFITFTVVKSHMWMMKWLMLYS